MQGFDRNNIKLSIIIPYYNRLPQITKLMSVLLPQLTKEVEVIIVDDGTNEKKLDKFNVRVIHLLENSGTASKPRNIGLDNANGKYITFIDSDDLVKPDYIQKILDKTKEEWDYCYFSWESDVNKIIIKDIPPKWNCCVWNCIYKKELIGNTRFDENLRIGEDYKFNQEVRKGIKANIKDILYYYNINSKDSLIKSGIVYKSEMENKK